MPNIRIFRKIIVGIIGRRRGNGVELGWHSKIIEHNPKEKVQSPPFSEGG